MPIPRPRSVLARLSLHAKIRALFLLPLCAVLLLQAAVQHYEAQGQRYEREAEQLEAWRATTSELYEILLAAESAVRGYRIQGERATPELLRPYEYAVAAAPALVAELRGMSAAIPQIAGDLQHFEDLVKRRLAAMTVLVNLPLSGGQASADVAAAAARGHALTEELRVEFDHFLAEEARLEELRERRLAAVTRIELLLQLALPILLIVTFLLIRWTTRQVFSRLELVGENLLCLVEGRPITRLPDDSPEARALNDAMARGSDLLRRREEESDTAKAEAERANTAKTAFLSRMSHELRTPLTAVLGFAELLEMDELSEDQRDSVRHIRSAGTHLLALINEVLDISRIESGNLAVSIEPLEVGSVIDGALSLIRPMAEERGIRLPGRVGSDLFLRADRQRLTQVLLNLLSNAVKYNREYGQVSMRCEQAGDMVRIAVTDTGMGIAPELMPRVFMPFDRLGAEQTTVEGTGVGLVLSKGLVEAMGGRLTVDSVPGQGTTFTVELPATVEPRATFTPAPPPRARAHGEYPADGRDLKVLYVEDNAANLDLVARFLGQMPNVKLITTMQGRLAVDMARLHRPDLVLLDLHLPDLDGESVLRRLREEPETASLRVAMLTADATPGQERRMRALGADDYLTKPLDFTRLSALLTPADPVAP